MHERRCNAGCENIITFWARTEYCEQATAAIYMFSFVFKYNARVIESIGAA